MPVEPLALAPVLPGAALAGVPTGFAGFGTNPDSVVRQQHDSAREGGVHETFSMIVRFDLNDMNNLIYRWMGFVDTDLHRRSGRRSQRRINNEELRDV